MKGKPFALSSQIQGYYVGPDLHEGPMPAVIYLALSAKESLELAPFNQPVKVFSSYPLRIFSLDLPFHEGAYSPEEALTFWAKEIEQDHNLVEVFVKKVEILIDAFLNQEILISKKIAVVGLSRGGFMACHVAAKIKEISSVVGFAPVTELVYAKDFSHLQENELAKSLGLSFFVDELTHCSHRYYIGNRDTRVDTRKCFEFTSHLTEAFFRHNPRSMPVEFRVFPSIGRHGHGTSDEVFEEGAHWIAKQLGVAAYGK